MILKVQCVRITLKTHSNHSKINYNYQQNEEIMFSAVQTSIDVGVLTS